MVVSIPFVRFRQGFSRPAVNFMACIPFKPRAAMVQRAKNVPRLMANDGEELLIAGSVIQHNEGIALPYAFRQSKEATVCVEGI